MASKSLQRKRNSFKGSQRTDITAMLKSMGRGSWDGVMNVYQELVSNPPKFLLQESDNIDHRCTKTIRMSDCNKTISTAAWGVQKPTRYQLITYTDRHVLPSPAHGSLHFSCYFTHVFSLCSGLHQEFRCKSTNSLLRRENTRKLSESKLWWTQGTAFRNTH